jgi:hypothetical protein
MTKAETLTATDWMRIVLALKSKLKSPVVQGNDRESRDWRCHLREIKQAIADSEQASLNEQDWVEVYYAIVDSDSEQDLAEKIGPDGKSMIESR